MERLTELEQMQSHYLKQIEETASEERKNGYWKALINNLQEQKEILKQQIENLKRQIR